LKKKKKKKEKKDRWARTEDAYSLSEERAARKKSKRKKSKSDARSLETTEFPEDAEGGLYRAGTAGESANGGTEVDVFSHQF
jgi:hypothetical protein